MKGIILAGLTGEFCRSYEHTFSRRPTIEGELA
jgi:hypothetical protein